MKLTVATTHEITVNLPQLADLIAVLGGSSIPQTLARLETTMAESFAELMQEIRSATQEVKDHRTAADAAEVQEDADAAARDEANAARIAELEAQIASGTLSVAQKDEARAAIAELRSAAGLSGTTETPAEGEPGTPAE